MERRNRRRVILVVTAAVGIMSIASRVIGRADEEDGARFVKGRVVALGLPGISAVSAVGRFLAGGPIHDKPAFAAYTLPGQVLDPARILVASTCNFGEPLANTDQLSGSILSIDPRGLHTLIVPALFAESGGQASALGGLVQMFSAQNPALLNSIHNHTAAT